MLLIAKQHHCTIYHHGISHSFTDALLRTPFKRAMGFDMGACGAQLTRAGRLHHVHAYFPDGSRLSAQVLLHPAKF